MTQRTYRNTFYLSIFIILLSVSCGSDEEPVDEVGLKEITADIFEVGQDCSSNPLIGSWVVEGMPNGIDNTNFGIFELGSNCEMVNTVCNQSWDFSVVLTAAGADLFISDETILDFDEDDIFGCLPHGDGISCDLKVFNDDSMIIDCSRSEDWPDYIHTFRRADSLHI